MESNGPFFPTEVSVPGLMRTNNEEALSKALTLRPVSQTAAGTLAWFKSQPAARQTTLLMGFDEPGGGLADSLQRESALLTASNASEAGAS